ncbi:COP1-interacting protein 7 isoform X3 [Helianthus annuus]|uniref:COP1-interacting protein 7 isoform X3 n=1 Tax=Helianthus annuus TaxID=4232 RepID=UPI000B906EA5|nr:COP1-interacting protein 7 isoform X3 [Helianthus annuus]
MKSTISLLDSAVFQLTPTRTRCDLYIIANGKKEKIASGLLNPFIAAHLKTAQDQIAEGGYSVLLAPQAGSNATWFTLQSFVSTPEILERVYTIESEILQVEEAIAIQGNTDISIKDQYIKPASSNEGNKPAGDVNEEEKAIVLYTVTNHQPDAPELPSPSTKERNSKAQLINVLETRKTVLKKEQGMAFARAVAAGFEIENVANLLSFAECFGASRLMSGCLRFMNLWKQKHESGQWVEIEAEDAMSDCTASAIVHSETAGTNTNAAGGEQQYHSWRTASRFPAMGYAFFTAR